jgi:hypothetical protein
MGMLRHIGWLCNSSIPGAGINQLKVRSMRISHLIRWSCLFVGLALAGNFVLPAAPPKDLSSVVSASDLEAEMTATIDGIEQGLASPEAYPLAAGSVRRMAHELALYSQAVAQFDEPSRLKTNGPALRDAALRISQTKSYADAKKEFEALKQTLIAGNSEAVPAEYEWSKLASLRLLMESMRERTDRIRKGLRRPKDPVLESRNAAVMAVFSLGIDSHADRIEQIEERKTWHALSSELQISLTRTAEAIRAGETSKALKEFTAAHKACNDCHEKFKR